MINDQFRRALFCYCTEDNNEQDDMDYLRFLMENYLDYRGPAYSVFVFGCMITAYRGRLPEMGAEYTRDFVRKLWDVLESIYYLYWDQYSGNRNLNVDFLQRSEDLREPEVALAVFVRSYAQEEVIQLLKKLSAHLCENGERVSVRTLKLLIECEAIASILQVVYRKKGVFKVKIQN